MNEQEREMDLALAECEQENRLLRARNDRLSIEVQLLTEALRGKAWVDLTQEEVEAYDDWADFQVGCGRQTLFDMIRDIEAKVKGKNT